MGEVTATRIHTRTVYSSSTNGGARDEEPCLKRVSRLWKFHGIMTISDRYRPAPAIDVVRQVFLLGPLLMLIRHQAEWRVADADPDAKDVFGLARPV